MRTRTRRVDKKIYEKAKKLINMNDANGGGYTRRELGEMLDPKLSDTTMSMIAVSKDFENYRDRILAKAKRHVRTNGLQLNLEDVAIVEKPVIIDTPEERLICDARTALIHNLWNVHSAIYAIAKSLEILLKINEEGKCNENEGAEG